MKKVSDTRTVLEPILTNIKKQSDKTLNISYTETFELPIQTVEIIYFF